MDQTIDESKPFPKFDQTAKLKAISAKALNSSLMNSPNYEMKISGTSKID